MTTHAQGKDGHAEAGCRIGGRLSKPEKLIERNLELSGEVAEIAHHHFVGEGVIPGRHWSVGGEDICGGHDLEGGVKVQIMLSHMQTNAFQGEESRVTFVHMIDFGFKSQGAKCLYPSDAEHDHLSHAHFEVTAV